MLKLVLKDKNFEIGKIRDFLVSAGQEPGYFIENYGELGAGTDFPALLEFREKAKKAGFNCGIIESEPAPLPAAEKVVKVDIESEFLRLAGNGVFSVNFPRIKLIALGLVKKETYAHNRFREDDQSRIENRLLEANQTSWDADLCLEITARSEPSRFSLDSGVTDYSYLGRTRRLEPGSPANFRTFLSDLALFAGKAETNKTLDLFLAGKNIQYFIHGDYSSFEKELKWLMLVNDIQSEKK